MIYWAIFVTIFGAAVWASVRFVPVQHRLNYHNCRKDWVGRLATILCHSIWIIAAIQNIVAPSDFAPWLRLAGAVFMVGGYALQIWAWRVNYFLLPVIVYVPPQCRATTGPYRFLSHPFYMGATSTALGAVLLLGQGFALFPYAAYLLLIECRVYAEDRILSQTHSS